MFHYIKKFLHRRRDIFSLLLPSLYYIFIYYIYRDSVGGIASGLPLLLLIFLLLLREDNVNPKEVA